MNELIIIIITGILGATLTYFISHNVKQGPVRSSALLSLLVGLFFYLFPEVLNPYLTKNIPIVFIGASFIGMVSSTTHRNYLSLVFAGTLFSLIYAHKNHIFEGFGGALGALAFITLLASMGGLEIISKGNKKIKAYLKSRK
ncbi:hypothetical protein SCB49_12339 [unidentified eubacterium SCB49]|nr:hypothetical protein SCB49_12339 [unidentified eubacterium SCB49]